MHPGKLPLERGSTTLYYSILNQRNCSVTAFFMTEKIDNGQTICIYEYPVPAKNVDIDRWGDHVLRADCFIKALAVLNGDEEPYSVKETESEESFNEFVTNLKDFDKYKTFIEKVLKISKGFIIIYILHKIENPGSYKEGYEGLVNSTVGIELDKNSKGILEFFGLPNVKSKYLPLITCFEPLFEASIQTVLSLVFLINNIESIMLHEKILGLPILTTPLTLLFSTVSLSVGIYRTSKTIISVIKQLYQLFTKNNLNL